MNPKKMSENANKKIPSEIMPHCENLTLTHIITLIAVSVCILRHFFIETMTTNYHTNPGLQKCNRNKLYKAIAGILTQTSTMTLAHTITLILATT